MPSQEASMPKKILKTFLYLTLGITLAGCSSLKAMTYVETKERVDQEPSGNAGVLFGTPATPANPNVKKTRDIYVLEITKKVPDQDLPITHQSVSSNQPSLVNNLSQPNSEVSNSSSSLPVQTSAILEGAKDRTLFVPPSLPAQYTVNKDDTLQTISKKFYNSYTKWPKIYEVNKDKISDPNRIKSGVVLTIPEI